MQGTDNKEHASGNGANLSESAIPIVQPFGQRVHIPTEGIGPRDAKDTEGSTMYAEFDS